MARAKRAAAVVKAKQSFRVGIGMFVNAGDLFESDSEVVVKRPHMFEDVAGAAVRTTATVPGEVTQPPAQDPPDDTAPDGD